MKVSMSQIYEHYKRAYQLTSVTDQRRFGWQLWDSRGQVTGHRQCLRICKACVSRTLSSAGIVNCSMETVGDKP